MSNYPEHHGKYERTELVKSRFLLTVTTKRHDRLVREAHEAEATIRELKSKIETLAKADIK